MRLSSPSVRLWLPAVLAIAVSVFLAGYVLDQRRERLHNDLMADFSYESRELAVRVAGQLTGYRQILRGSRSLMTVLGTVGQDQWVTYSENLFLANDFPGLEILGFAPRVLQQARAEHEARVRRTAFADYQVAPLGDGAQALAPVVRLEPVDAAHGHLIGFNLASDSALQAALAHSARTGKTALSAPTGGSVPGHDAKAPRVFLFQPLYRAGLASAAKATEAEQARLDQISGWVFGAFRVDQMLQRTLEPLPRNMRLQVFAARVADPRLLLYDSAPNAATEAPHSDRPALQVTVPLELEGQTWSLVFEGFPRAYSQEQGIASADLTAVMLICLLFGVSAILATVSRQRAVRLAQLAEALQQSNARYEFLATHDALTQVANRVLFQRSLDAQVANSARYGSLFAVIYIDLDKFKQVNDRLGHEAGDQVLIEATQRLTALLRQSDLVARRGGDEFVVMLPQIEDLSSVTGVADKICAALATPIPLAGGATGSIAGSLGIAIYPHDGTDSEKLIQTADHRMYRAKQRGGNCWIAHDEL